MSSDRIVRLLSIFTIALGLLQVFLEAAVVATFRNPLQHHSTVWPPPHWHPAPATIVRPLNLVPRNLATEQTQLMVACGLLSVGAGVVGCLSYRSRERNRGAVLVVLGVGSVALTVFAAFVYVLVEEYVLSSPFRYTDFYSTGQRFTRESWVCQLRDLYTEDEVVSWVVVCLEARVGRWLFVPLLATLSSITWMSYNNSNNKGKTLSHVRRWSLLKQPRYIAERDIFDLISADH